MVLAQDLRDAVLQVALQGKLTEQLETDSSVDEMLENIKEEKKQLIKEKKIKKEKELPLVEESDIPFEIPKNWKWARFQNICKVLTCGYASTPEYITKEDGGKPFLSAKNVKPYKFIPKEYNYIKPELFLKLREGCCPQKGDILLTRVGAGIGEAAIIDTDLEFAIYVSLTLIKLVNNNLISNKYILYWLNSPIGIKAANDNTLGKKASQGNLNVNNVRTYLLPIPPIEEQQRIVDRVDELMRKIDDYEKVEKELVALEQKIPDDMKNALLQAAMQGKLTEQLDSDSSVNEMLDAIEEEKKQLIKEKKIKKEKVLSPIAEDDIPFEIPDNWKWVQLGEVVSLKMGKTPPRAELEYWGDDYPWISIADMIENGYIDRTKEKISYKGYKEKFGEEISKKGTLIMSFKLTIGRVSILNIDALHNEAIVSIVPYNDKLNQTRNYLFKVLPFLTIFGKTKNAIKGNTLNSKSLNALLIPLPPIEEQQRIVERLEQLLPLCETL